MEYVANREYIRNVLKIFCMENLRGTVYLGDVLQFWLKACTDKINTHKNEKEQNIKTQNESTNKRTQEINEI